MVKLRVLGWTSVLSFLFEGFKWLFQGSDYSEWLFIRYIYTRVAYRYRRLKLRLCSFLRPEHCTQWSCMRAGVADHAVSL